MKLPGWAYILVGLVVGGVSAYMYKFVPKDGQPNNAMAFFFFVGMIFILIGIVKVFFRRVDTIEDARFEQTISQTSRNRVEEHVKRMHQTNMQAPRQQQDTHPSQQTAQHSTQHQAHHSNYAKSHPYHGIQSTTQQRPAQPTIIQCKKCGSKNHSTSNYCHVCGNRLR
jgi:hypothetical protein